MIILGWKIKPITELNIDIPELESSCEKHKLKYRIIIGKRYNTLYFIPINYFWASEQVFKTCDKCISDYDELPSKYEKIILNYYHKKISSKDLHNKINLQAQEYKKQAEIDAKKDDQNLRDFIKMIPYIIGFIILMLIIKFLLF